MNNLLICDGYKQSHRQQYPEGTTLVYSNFTPRSAKHAKRAFGLPDDDPGVVVFGIQAFIQKYLIDDFNQNFFNKTTMEVVKEYEESMTNYLGAAPSSDHVAALRNLGYLPIRVAALPEGTICPIGIPVLTIYNTLPEFFWLPNFLETILSAELWLPMTSATISFQYRRLLDYFAEETCDDKNHLAFQAHDFSMRGLEGLEAGKMSGAGHLLSFLGTDTIPAIGYLKKYYKATEPIGLSVPATEHSVMSAGGHANELSTFSRLISHIYPSGIVSIVSDTWDLWKVVDQYLPVLKEEILARDGKVVIRPDSGDPVDIIAGSAINSDERFEGVIEKLWNIFGGITNDKGYKVLDPHIGCIYGDSITLERAREICQRLKLKGFASSNIVFGVGSYTFQYNTRDTYGFAMKATYCEIDGKGRNIYKDPVTDDGTKKSATGLLRVVAEGDRLVLKEKQTWVDVYDSELQVVFDDGNLCRFQTLDAIRANINSNIERLSNG